ncbi:MAG TPA: riboflavin synthase [Solirubrobacteraceae bacterium]
MFTGLIADLGRIEAVEHDAEGATLRIATALADELREGDSIAVDGVCLTATGVVVGGPAVRASEGARAKTGSDATPGEFAAQAMHETLQRSTLGALTVGSPVNLELALRADGRLGGHIVQGHVDGVATVAEIRTEGFSRVLALDIEATLRPLVVEKGSIALNGVSLTVSALLERGLEVSLIPETLQRTTLGASAVGDAVNVEVDILAKHVQRLLGAHA